MNVNVSEGQRHKTVELLCVASVAVEVGLGLGGVKNTPNYFHY